MKLNGIQMVTAVCVASAPLPDGLDLLALLEATDESTADMTCDVVGVTRPALPNACEYAPFRGAMPQLVSSHREHQSPFALVFPSLLP